MKSHLLLLPVIGLVVLISENVECVRFSADGSSAVYEIAQHLCYNVCEMIIRLNSSRVEHSQCSKNCRIPMSLHLKTKCFDCKLESRMERCEYSRDCKDSSGIFQLTSPSATVAEKYWASTTEETKAENDDARNCLQPPEAGKSIVGFTVFLSILVLLAIVSICLLVLLIFAISQILRAPKLE